MWPVAAAAPAPTVNDATRGERENRRSWQNAMNNTPSLDDLFAGFDWSKLFV